MARTRGGLNNAARPNTFNNRRFFAAKEIANVHRRNHQIKTKFLLPQSKKMQVKRRGNVVTELTEGVQYILRGVGIENIN